MTTIINLSSLTEELTKHTYFTTDLYSSCEEAYCQSRANIMILRDTLPTKPDDTSIKLAQQL